MSSDEDSANSEVDLNNLPKEHFLKLLILGDLGVGKTSLVKKYCSSDSGPEYKVSVDVTHSCKSVNVNGLKINLQLWDIPGHERFGGMTRVHYKYADGVAIVFDLSRPETFEGALSWLSDVTQKLFDEKRELAAAEAAHAASTRLNCSAEDSLKANKAMPVILLANKCDLAALKVPRQKYSTYVQENGLLAWFETSSKDASSMAHAMKTLVEYILENEPSMLPIK